MFNIRANTRQLKQHFLSELQLHDDNIIVTTIEGMQVRN